MPPPIRLIVNPSAGGGRARRVAPVALQALMDHGLQVQRVDTRDITHARELAWMAADAGETIVAVSGDGLFGMLADAVRERPGVTLGLIPGGRGNDFARVLGIPNDPREAAAVIADGHTRPVDLGLVCSENSSGPGMAFVGIASAGFDSEANRIANEAPSWMGGLVYLYGALRALAAWRAARVQIELDPPAQAQTFEVFSVGAANSKAYGGGMIAAPDALLDDGMLEVMLLEDVGKFRFVTRILPKVFKGTHTSEPGVRAFRAREMVLRAERPFTMYADGDPIGDLPVRVRALAGAITMLLPQTAEAQSAFVSGGEHSDLSRTSGAAGGASTIGSPDG